MAWRTATAGALALLAVGAGAAEDPLAPYRRTARVLVLAAPGEDDRSLAAHPRALAPAGAGVRERDLAVIEAVGDGERARALRRRLDLPPGAFRAVLVGKDGGVKLTSDTPIPPRRLFSTIDAMPMRRDEMRRR